MWAAVSVVVITGLLNFKDGPFIRPHPAFWRIILAFAVVYQMCLVVLFFLNKNHARELFKFIDPTLGVPLPEKSYAEDCSLFNIKVVKDTVLDVFVIAHGLGWFAKALILRDYWLCWVLSVSFELMEYSLQHQLKFLIINTRNFKECWWDHWVLDVLLANWAGIYLGMKTCEYFEVKVF